MTMSTSNNAVILEAQAEFAMALLREASASKAPASVIMSPVSVAIALSMAFAGARNETEHIHRHFGSFLQKISAADKSYTLKSANRIYMQEGFPLFDKYKDLLTGHYLGQFQSLDFGKSVEAAKQATHSKSHDLVQASSLSAITKIVLINAIYFKGTWKEKFNGNFTVKKPFHISENLEKEVDMMRKRKTKLPYFANNQIQVLGLPYDGSEASLYVVLPKERFGLSKLFEESSGKTVLELIQKCNEIELEVQLSKFKLESTLGLKEALIKLGLDNAFSGSADFTGISEMCGLQISDVIQKAFIKVNENGTEAAAATMVAMVHKMLTETHHERFIADRPFLYFIVIDNKHILFAGHFSG